jgi:hypothetical protein
MSFFTAEPGATTMSDNQRPPQKLTIFNVMSMWMYADPVMGATKRPNLRVGVFGNVPRISVRTNVEGDRNNGKIDFNTDLATFAAAMSSLKKIAEGTAKEDCYNFDYIDDFVAGKKLDRPVVISTLQVGRDKETGRLYIAVLAPESQNRPRIRFFFGPSKYHNIRLRDGSPLGAAEMSEAYAIGFLEPACQLVYTMLAGDHFDENAKNVAKMVVPGQGGGNSGGYNNNRGGNGGYNNNRGGGNGGGYNNNRGGQAQAPAAMDDFDAEIPHF